MPKNILNVVYLVRILGIIKVFFLVKKVFLLKFCLFLALFLCFTINNRYSFSKESKHKTAKEYYLDGLYSYTDRNYKPSAEQFEELSKNYPYSEYTRNSIVMEAYTNYLSKEYDKIQGIYEIFYKLFPDDEYMPYMTYMLAMSYYVYTKNNNRDNLIESIEIFTNLLEKYPTSKYTENVKEKINYLNKKLQLNSIKVGEIYQKNGDYIGAMKRYTGLFETYKDNIDPELEELALCRIVVLLKTLDIHEDTKKYNLLLKEKYPNSKCSKQNMQ